MTPTPESVSTPGTTPIRLGTRASALATTQSGLVARRLEELTGRPVELVRISTEGDVRTGSLATLGGTGVFVTALREALLDGRCDVAVHSLKDLPTAPAEGLTYVTPEREDPRDVLCARDGLTLEGLPFGARVGTGSPRRAAQVRAARPDLDVVDIRGNVDTRLARALGPEADLDAVVLAFAGLARLGRTDAVSEVLETDVVSPAPGQGALAVEVRTADVAGEAAGYDVDLARAIRALDHRQTRLAVLAERSVLARLEAGCAAPVGAYAVVEGGVLLLSAVVARVDGTEQLMHSSRAHLSPDAGPDELDGMARDLGVRVAEALLLDGADRLAPLTAAPAHAASAARPAIGTLWSDAPEGE
ncbi:hydroxymethylbilane synthase [Antribacter sp. KLBMP9083]|uniref:Porphobilinogen deaminase n=1 Tax=Antribacter soli TaxID=2910976 RepID=A0AA41QDJ9_9MICO|nr:hydroxymethylbilane synthase [Antribacter soli]MCF4120636.1 hydroxymethylbilane synthase [Antribacter soli]